MIKRSLLCDVWLVKDDAHFSKERFRSWYQVQYSIHSSARRATVWMTHDLQGTRDWPTVLGKVPCLLRRTRGFRDLTELLTKNALPCYCVLSTRVWSRIIVQWCALACVSLHARAFRCINVRLHALACVLVHLGALTCVRMRLRARTFDPVHFRAFVCNKFLYKSLAFFISEWTESGALIWMHSHALECVGMYLHACACICMRN